MKRKLLVLLTTFLLLLLAFWAYRLATQIDAPIQTSGGSATAPARPDVGSDQGLDLHVEMRDNQGRLQAVYDWPEWEKVGDDRYRVTQPRVVFYREKGQRIYVWADSGVVQAERLARGYNIRRGTLLGQTSRGVRIFFDNSTEGDRKPPLERTEEEMRRELIRFFTERIEFDNQQLLIRTDNPVQMLSGQADVYGKGLHITWNENPRELRQLRIEQGERMVMYNVSDRDDPFSLGLSSPPAAAAPTSQPGAGGQATAPASQPAPAPASRPRPATGSARSKPDFERKNVYLAEFYDNVRVRSGPRSLDGAQKLTMEFEWAGQAEDLTSSSRRSPSTRPASAPAATPSTAPAASAPASEPASAPADRPARGPATRPVDRTVTITWSGPMILTPIRHVPNPARGNYLVAGEGPQVALKDDRNTAFCRSFVLERQRPDAKSPARPRMKGQLLGTREQPARLLLEDGQEIACEDIRFDRIAQRAWLTGPGYMIQPHDEKGPTTQPASQPATRPATRPAPAGPRRLDRVTWTEKLAVVFGLHVPAPGQKGSARDYVRQADIHGDVKLVQGLPMPAPPSIPPGCDLVESDRLVVEMEPDNLGKPYLKTANAVGKAHARQETTDIRADMLSVSFQPLPPAKAAKAADGKGRFQTRRSQPTAMLAQGNAVVTDTRDAAQPLRATADTITSDPVRRTALLTGSDVRISQGPNVMSGTHIRLEEAGQVARVTGPGSLDFLTDKDLNGARLSKPRPIRITWADSMDYAGTRNSAIFAGQVKLRSQSDQMDCRQMQVVFERNEPSTKPAKTRPATTKPADRGPLAMAEYSRRRLSMILADGQVVLQTRRTDEHQSLLRRIQLACEKLVYNAGAAQVDIVGGGTMLAEDYRPPQPSGKAPAATARAGDPLSGNVESPSQTAFRWDKSLVYMQEQRSVSMEGNVLMVHRSGDKVVLADQVNRPAWPQPLPSGRRSEIACERLLARFGEPPKTPKPATRPATATAPSTAPATRPADDLDLGPRLGPLKLFHATGQVNMRDGNRQILAQRLVYDRSTELDLAVIWGYLPGQQEADATIYEEDPDKGTSRSWSSPKIIWDRKNDTITADKASGGGGR